MCKIIRDRTHTGTTKLKNKIDIENNTVRVKNFGPEPSSLHSETKINDQVRTEEAIILVPRVRLENFFGRCKL